MMALDQLLAQINQFEHALPPVEQWHPTHRGKIDIRIDSSGQWYYENSVFTRQSLVRLLSSILVYENKTYWLKTPVEQLEIKVDDAPFVITQWAWANETAQSIIVLTTNVEQQLLLTKDMQFCSQDDKLYLPVQRGLKAVVHRNIFYQWVEIANEVELNGQPHLAIQSDGKWFSLGAL